MLIISFTVRDHVFWPFNSNIHRISDLPDSILSHILSFLPTKFVATTSILSKRWKPVWLYVLILNFDDKAFNPNLVKVRINYDMDNLITLVSKANILHISQLVADDDDDDDEMADEHKVFGFDGFRWAGT
ncbi:putative F-box/LRR-repeat protein At5g41840 isoform X2 [Vicia villosa]|uniref:putative F-box/LRR-repeat protein At5g41840 isoform X2 n=1 Tax=Vicia villosa TaxID=3911 RepID=UPI00273C3E3E|nr:putative F-box/LRR-repeat protein At5g41840 isoform X2 [Vicia villosa]